VSADEFNIEAIQDKVIEIISEQMGVGKAEITRETSFINDLNTDSLDTIELVMEFEDEFGIRIPDEEAEEIQTVGAAIDYIVKELDSEIASEIVGETKVTIYDGRAESDRTRIETHVSWFAEPEPNKIFSVSDMGKMGFPPHGPGVYGWYFDDPPPYVLEAKKGCTAIKTGKWPSRKKWWLLYIGKAEHLNERIVKYHIKGEHYAKGTMSSLRLSLGCLLSKKLRLRLCWEKGTSGKKEESFEKKGKKLDDWFQKHARIAWVETTQRHQVEIEAIAKYVLPLNHKHNTHPLKKPLSRLRKKFRDIAKDPDRKPKRKYFRKAYREFVKEVRSLVV